VLADLRRTPPDLVDADLLEELEYTLITADLGVRTVEDILERIRQRVDRKMTGDAAEIRNLIRQQLLEVLRASETPIRVVTTPPAVVMVVGVNGAGKTTTIRMITTLLPAPIGTIEVFGVDVARHKLAVRGLIGYVPQQLSADAALTGRETWRCSPLI